MLAKQQEHRGGWIGYWDELAAILDDTSMGI
jgi:hypothetical protein